MENRVENWKKFAEHMEKYIKERTVEKYGVKNSGGEAGFDVDYPESPDLCLEYLAVFFTHLERETKNS
ncbi:MAG: hypothetical protein WAL93_13675 [Desulfobacterales bacterium]